MSYGSIDRRSSGKCSGKTPMTERIQKYTADSDVEDDPTGIPL